MAPSRRTKPPKPLPAREDGVTKEGSPEPEAAFFRGAEFAQSFFMRRSRVHDALRKLVDLLESDDIPYAIVGAMALNAFGYERVTRDIDLLLTRGGLEAFKAAHVGRGYLETVPGSRGLRDTEYGVPIDIVLAGDYPGDEAPKPVSFPDPGQVTSPGQRPRLLPLRVFIELKLASGMTAPHRLRDLADVLELIKIRELGLELSEELNPYVREKYRELWQASRSADPERDG
jgi:hypothetical protein